MTRVRLDQLPLKVRRKIESKIAGVEPPLESESVGSPSEHIGGSEPAGIASRTPRSTSERLDPGGEWECRTCPEPYPRFTEWAPTERHAREHDAARIEFIAAQVHHPKQHER